MRRLAITLLVAPLAGWAGLSLAAPQAAAGDDEPATEPATEQLAPVDVLQVSGLFDEVLVQAVHDAIADSEANGAQALILQLDTRGAVVGDEVMRALLQRVADAEVPIGVWVGPSRGSRAYGTPAQLFGVADITSMVPGSRVGHTGPLLELAGDQQVDLGPSADVLRAGSLSFGEARRGLVLRGVESDDTGLPTVRSLIFAMDGIEVDGNVLDTIVEQLADDGSVQALPPPVHFRGLGLGQELFHTVASPAMAYLLLMIGLGLLIFELFTAGVGLAGAIGAVCVVLGSYGMAELPVRPVALAMLVVAMVAFAVDVQVGIPRLWTGVGFTLFVLGSWFLYEPLPGNSLRLSWVTLVVGIVGVLLTFVVGMPSMVRTRFATPTIGREWMIGSSGTAVGAIDPDGVAQVGDAKWRARTNRATPIAAGDQLQVIAIDGVTLEVEPLDGAARDYRERRGAG